MALDFGTGGKLALYGERGDGTVGRLPVPRLRPRGGAAGARSEAEKFADRVALLLGHFDLVTESATVGSSGAEPAAVDAALAATGGRLWLLPTRAVKNWVNDHGLATLGTPGDGTARPTDAQSAEIQYRIATGNPAALRPYTGKAVSPLRRRFTSVRPADKRGYTGDYAGVPVTAWLALLPDAATLPVFADAATGAVADLGVLLGDGTGGYRRSAVFPFAIALAEDAAADRDGFEAVLGLCGHGYPSFYRRATVDLMQEIAKTAFGRELLGDVTAAERKAAWRLTRRAVRWLYTHADHHRARSIAPRPHVECRCAGCVSPAATAPRTARPDRRLPGSRGPRPRWTRRRHR